MRRKKKEKLEHQTFWANFAYFNLSPNLTEVPSHVDCVRFRYYQANDLDLWRMVQLVKSVNQLDLDGTDVTDEGMEHLLELHYLREIRLKGCRDITNIAMEYICQFKGLELLHLHGTQITTAGLSKIHKLKDLRRLLIQADRNDPGLVDVYASLPKDCCMTVNYKAYPFDEP